MGLALQFKAFVSTGKYFTSSWRSLAKIRKWGKEMGKRGEKQLFFLNPVQRKKHLKREIASIQKLCSTVCPPWETTASNSNRAADKYTDLLNSRQETGNVVSHRAGTALPDKDTEAEAQAGLQHPPPTLPVPGVHPQDEQSWCSGWRWGFQKDFRGFISLTSLLSLCLTQAEFSPSRPAPLQIWASRFLGVRHSRCEHRTTECFGLEGILKPSLGRDSFQGPGYSKPHSDDQPSVLLLLWAFQSGSIKLQSC